MEEYKRFTISLPQKLYDEFEVFREKLNISRSDLIRKAMKAYMVSEEQISVQSETVVGCITLIMSHEHFDFHEHDSSERKKGTLQEHAHDLEHHDEHEHDHDYVSRPVYASVHQTDEILKNDIQHHFHDLIISTMHVHLEFDKCLEIIAVSGTHQRVLKLKEDLQRLRSVISIGLFIVDKET